MKIFILLLFILTSCQPNRTCIAADDFGFEKVTISARYDPSYIFGKNENQLAVWNDIGIVANGLPIALYVKPWAYKDNLDGTDNNTEALSAWCPWYGTDKNFHTLSSICRRLPNCTFNEGKCCGQISQIQNAPCLLTGGMGLYLAIAKSGQEVFPTLSDTLNIDLKAFNFHVGQPPLCDSNGNQIDPNQGNSMPYNGGTGETDPKPCKYFYDYDANGSLIKVPAYVFMYPSTFLINSTNNVSYQNGKIYAKIYDSYYNDNAGQYQLVFKSGVGTTIQDPFQQIVSDVKSYLFGANEAGGAVNRIYNQIITNSGYINIVNTLLILFIMGIGFSYAIGLSSISCGDTVIKCIKLCIITILINSSVSWSFFYDNFFTIFVNGPTQIQNLMLTSGGTSNTILSMMLSSEVVYKVLSLLFANGLGIVYVLLYLILLCMVIYVYMQITVFSLLAMIAVSILVSLGPIFLLFILFKITRNLFDNWIKFLISYSVQPIILSVGLALISFIIQNSLYKALGFRICQRPIFQLWNNAVNLLGSFGKSLGLDNTLLFWWVPNPDGYNVSFYKKDGELLTDNIPIPEAHLDANGYYCPPYGCIGERYVEFPYLDPNIPADVELANNMASGHFLQIENLFVPIICTLLLIRFTNLAISLSSIITRTSYSFVNFGSTAFGFVDQKRLDLIDSLKKGLRNNFNEARSLNKASRNNLDYSDKPGAQSGSYEDLRSRPDIRKIHNFAIGKEKSDSPLMEEALGQKQYELLSNERYKAYYDAMQKLTESDPSLKDCSAKVLSAMPADALREFVNQKVKDELKTSQLIQEALKGYPKSYTDLSKQKRSFIDYLMSEEKPKSSDLNEIAKAIFDKNTIQELDDNQRAAIHLLGKNGIEHKDQFVKLGFKSEDWDKFRSADVDLQRNILADKFFPKVSHSENKLENIQEELRHVREMGARYVDTSKQMSERGIGKLSKKYRVVKEISDTMSSAALTAFNFVSRVYDLKKDYNEVVREREQKKVEKNVKDGMLYYWMIDSAFDSIDKNMEHKIYKQERSMDARDDMFIRYDYLPAYRNLMNDDEFFDVLKKVYKTDDPELAAKDFFQNVQDMYNSSNLSKEDMEVYKFLEDKFENIIKTEQEVSQMEAKLYIPLRMQLDEKGIDCEMGSILRQINYRSGDRVSLRNDLYSYLAKDNHLRGVIAKYTNRESITDEEFIYEIDRIGLKDFKREKLDSFEKRVMRLIDDKILGVRAEVINKIDNESRKAVIGNMILNASDHHIFTPKIDPIVLAAVGEVQDKDFENFIFSKLKKAIEKNKPNLLKNFAEGDEESIKAMKDFVPENKLEAFKDFIQRQ